MLLVWSKCFPSVFGRLLEHNNHKGSHEECAVRLLVELARSIVEDLEILVALICKQPTKLPDVLMGLSQITRAEVLVERLVHEFLDTVRDSIETYVVDVKEECL